MYTQNNTHSINPEYVLILSGDHIYKMDYDVICSSLTRIIIIMPGLTVAVLKILSKKGHLVTPLLNLRKPENLSQLSFYSLYSPWLATLRQYGEEKSNVDMSDLVKNVIPNYLWIWQCVMLYDFSCAERCWRSWEANMEYIQKMLDTKINVGRFILVTWFGQISSVKCQSRRFWLLMAAGWWTVKHSFFLLGPVVVVLLLRTLSWVVLHIKQD